VMVTHEMSFAAKISDKVVFMEAGEIVEVGTPAELFGNTRTPRLQQFLKPWFDRSLSPVPASTTDVTKPVTVGLDAPESGLIVTASRGDA
jgi:polar amino acid transport system ATP-binding protein